MQFLTFSQHPQSQDPWPEELRRTSECFWGRLCILLMRTWGFKEVKPPHERHWACQGLSLELEPWPPYLLARVLWITVQKIQLHFSTGLESQLWLPNPGNLTNQPKKCHSASDQQATFEIVCFMQRSIWWGIEAQWHLRLLGLDELNSSWGLPLRKYLSLKPPSLQN